MTNINNPRGIIIVTQRGTGFNNGDYTYGEEYIPVVHSTAGEVVEWEKLLWCNSDFSYCSKCGSFGEYHECWWESPVVNKAQLLKAIGSAKFIGLNQWGQEKFDASQG